MAKASIIDGVIRRFGRKYLKRRAADLLTIVEIAVFAGCQAPQPAVPTIEPSTVATHAANAAPITDVFFQATLHNHMGQPVWFSGSGGTGDSSLRIGPGETQAFTIALTGPDYSYDNPPQGIWQIGAADKSGATVFCQTYTTQDLVQLHWEIDLIPAQVTCDLGDGRYGARKLP